MSIVQRGERYWYTLRHLRWEQVWFRLWRRIWNPRLAMGSLPAVRPAGRAWPLKPWRAACMTGEQTFRFLNVERVVNGAASWNTATNDKLWLYNLHYFDDLNADGFPGRREWHARLVCDWIEHNPPAHGNGWEPYPIALRVVNWITWDLAGQALSAAAQASLALQARALRGTLEYHLLGNHLWADAKALVFAGTYFSGPEADEWRNKGLALVNRELLEQVLDDGGHFELSPMYHCIILNDLIELVALSTCFTDGIDDSIVGGWRAHIDRMAAWLEIMSHPDGDIASFNDTALGIAPRLDQLLPRLRAIGAKAPDGLRQGLQLLRASGYARLDFGQASLIVDVGAVGPDYLPGHAHADTLSMELSIAGRRLIVDPGTSVYHACPERLRQRGTAAHNTVVVNDEDSSEVWSSFRVARRAYPGDVATGGGPESAWISASHDGYLRLPGRVRHWRRWEMDRSTLTIHDRIDGTFESAEGGFLIHPDWLARIAGDSIELVHGQTTISVSAINARLGLRPATWSPTFGRDDPASRVTVAPVGPEWSVLLSWSCGT